MKVVEFVLGDLSRVAHGWTVAVVPEGYTQADLKNGLFDADVAKFVKRLLVTAPFSRPELRPLLNVVMVRQASAHSGEGIQLRTPAAAESTFGTEFGAVFGRDTFQGKQIERSLYGNSAKVIEFVRRQPRLQPVSHFLVIVNNTHLDGGTMHGEVGWFSKNRPSWPDVAVHELGHQAFQLADEYPYTRDRTDPVSVIPAVAPEPEAPNVTKVKDAVKIKWSDLLTVPPWQVPTTVTSTPCTREHPVIADPDPPIPAGAVGAYEGADHHDCGVFRPSLQCRMRESNDPFCRVCEMRARLDIGRHLLSLSRPTPCPAGSWTHVQSFMAASHPPRMLSHSMATGAYAISPAVGYYGVHHRPDGTPPLLETNHSLGTGSIGAGWSSLVPFELGGTLHYLGHQAGSGAQAIFAMNEFATVLTPTHTTPPGHATHTHVVTLHVAGAPHYIGYDYLSGDAGLFRLDSATADPVPVNTMQWGRGHTAVVALMIRGEPHAMTYRMHTGEVMIRRLTPTGFTMAFASRSGFWKRTITHVAPLDIDHQPYLVRYSGIDGSAYIHYVREDATGVDPVCHVPPPGIGGLSLFGVGASAIGQVDMPHADGSPAHDLYFYNAKDQSLSFSPLSPK
ncbi:M64 family metallopeptidase [Streptomyces sp. NPDC001903]|uniref:M64 family metallopeptidase n=1 Tax=Streptomyces sp. NPDC001903 TaxID=3364622 RepID=UPI00369CF055